METLTKRKEYAYSKNRQLSLSSNYLNAMWNVDVVLSDLLLGQEKPKSGFCVTYPDF